ncbi:uncharacterized protein [Typha angustifolia]|uniref:uncharacterized protein n=1 Tax=Typha angustifolia TaxID=59011 RepID=UPI003C2D16B8
MFVAMKRRALSTPLEVLFLLLLSNICCGSESDIECLRTLKQSLKDPHNYLVDWDFTNLYFEGSICSFTGVECWSATENKVLNLHLSNMGLEGHFPLGLEDCSSLTGLDLSNNHLSGPIPADISKTLTFVTTLDLSNNRFSGEIPIGLSNCRYLNVLDLQHNQLTGEIPWQMCHLIRLTSINVDDNLLSGPIPPFFSNLSSGSFANNPGLCDQLQTPDCPSIYEGNINFCGPPVSNNFSGTDAGMSSFYLSMGVGFATGFWVIFGALLFNMTWRTAYFLFMDSISDKIYVFVVLKWNRLIASIKRNKA